MSSWQQERITTWHGQDGIWSMHDRTEPKQAQGRTGRQIDGRTETLGGQRDRSRARTGGRQRIKAVGKSRNRMMDGRRIITTAGRETNARSPQNAITQLFWRHQLSIIVTKAKRDMSGVRCLEQTDHTATLFIRLNILSRHGCTGQPLRWTSKKITPSQNNDVCFSSLSFSNTFGRKWVIFP